MDKDTLIKNLALNVREFGVPVLTALDQAFVAGYETGRKELTAHNTRKVIQYNMKGESIATFYSIASAAKANKYSRDVIDDSVSGRTSFTKKGYYFRYAENEK